MKIYLGADHRGFKLKGKIKKWLEEWGYEVRDMGNIEYEKTDDYPDYADRVAKKVQKKGRGILVCGSGVGMSVAANKHKEVRSILGFDKEQVRHGVESDDGNVLSLAADHFKDNEARELVKVFLETEYGKEERNIRRLKKVTNIEKGSFA